MVLEPNLSCIYFVFFDDGDLADGVAREFRKVNDYVRLSIDDQLHIEIRRRSLFCWNRRLKVAEI